MGEQAVFRERQWSGLVHSGGGWSQGGRHRPGLGSEHLCWAYACVPLDSVLSHFETQFPHVQNGRRKAHFRRVRRVDLMDVVFPLPAHDTLRKAVLLGAAWAGLPADRGARDLTTRLRGEMEEPGLRMLSLEGGAVAKLLSESGYQGLSFWRLSPPESCWTPGRGWRAHL